MLRYTGNNNKKPTCQRTGLWEWTQKPQPRWAGWRGWLYSPVCRTATPLTGSGWHPPERRSPAVKHPRAQDSTWRDSAHFGRIWQNKTSWWVWCCRLVPTQWLHRKQKRWLHRCTTSSVPGLEEKWGCATRLYADAPSPPPSNQLTVPEIIWDKCLNSEIWQHVLLGFPKIKQLETLSWYFDDVCGSQAATRCA